MEKEKLQRDELLTKFLGMQAVAAKKDRPPICQQLLEESKSLKLTDLALFFSGYLNWIEDKYDEAAELSGMFTD